MSVSASARQFAFSSQMSTSPVFDHPLSLLGTPSGDRGVSLGAPFGSSKAVAIPVFNSTPAFALRADGENICMASAPAVRSVSKGTLSGNREHKAGSKNPFDSPAFSASVVAYDSRRVERMACHAIEGFLRSFSAKGPFVLGESASPTLCIRHDRFSIVSGQQFFRKYAEGFVKALNAKGYACTLYPKEVMGDVTNISSSINFESLFEGFEFLVKECRLSKPQIHQLLIEQVNSSTDRVETGTPPKELWARVLQEGKIEWLEKYPKFKDVAIAYYKLCQSGMINSIPLGALAFRLPSSEHQFLKATGPKSANDFSSFVLDFYEFGKTLRKYVGIECPFASTQPRLWLNDEGFSMEFAPEQAAFSRKFARLAFGKGYSCEFLESPFKNIFRIQSIPQALLFANRELGLSKVQIWHFYGGSVDYTYIEAGVCGGDCSSESDIAPELVSTLFQPREPHTIPPFPGIEMPHIFANLVREAFIHD